MPWYACPVDMKEFCSYGIRVAACLHGFLYLDRVFVEAILLLSEKACTDTRTVDVCTLKKVRVEVSSFRAG